MQTGKWFVNSAELPQEICENKTLCSSSKSLVFIEENLTVKKIRTWALHFSCGEKPGRLGVGEVEIL